MANSHEKDKNGLGSLCIRAASGDREAFRRLVDQTHRTVYRLAFHILGSEQDAEDVVQETYIRTWKGLPTLRNPKVVASWIYRVARNAAYDRLRKRSRQKADSLDRPAGEDLAPLVELLASDQPGPEDRFGSAEVTAAIRAALLKLKEKHRLILTLREVEGMSYEEIGTALGCSLGTVESRLHRARKALARRLRTLARELGKEI